MLSRDRGGQCSVGSVGWRGMGRRGLREPHVPPNVPRVLRQQPVCSCCSKTTRGSSVQTLAKLRLREKRET